jgi:uncharacterized protein YegP (UPF0339 family)
MTTKSPTKRLGRIEVYSDAAGGFRYRRIAANGRNVANPGESYTRRYNATHAAERENPGVPIVQVKG